MLCERLDHGCSLVVGAESHAPRITGMAISASIGTMAAAVDRLRANRKITMTEAVSMSEIDATSPNAAKGDVRSSKGGAAHSQAAVCGVGGVATIRPDESIPAQSPVLAARTMGVRVSMQRNRA
ncbi:MAG: hypothetical protein EBU31_07280, partial [Proteobacteria bacterium]|nr:hypothetical protein [Pseudomonadota bacterium]